MGLSGYSERAVPVKRSMPAKMSNAIDRTATLPRAVLSLLMGFTSVMILLPLIRRRRTSIVHQQIIGTGMFFRQEHGIALTRLSSRLLNVYVIPFLKSR